MQRAEDKVQTAVTNHNQYNSADPLLWELYFKILLTNMLKICGDLFYIRHWRQWKLAFLSTFFFFHLLRWFKWILSSVKRCRLTFSYVDDRFLSCCKSQHPVNTISWSVCERILHAASCDQCIKLFESAHFRGDVGTAEKGLRKI